MGKIVIHDTADVTITDLSTGKVVLNAEAQLAQITGAISEEDLKGGIGNRKLYKIRTDKEVNLTMRSAVADVEYWAMTQGVEATKGSATVTANEAGVLKQKDTTSPFELVLGKHTELKVDDKVRVTLPDGSQEKDFSVIQSQNEPTLLAVDLQTVSADGLIVLTDAFAKATAIQKEIKLTVFFPKLVEGRQIKIDSNKFSGKYKVEMKTIAYDLDTATITSDIYFLFPETIPAGEFDISLENGSVYTPEISFSVMNPIGSSEMGEIIEVAR